MTDRRLRIAIAAVALVGLGISGYLTGVHYADAAPLCKGVGDCARVQLSDYAEVAGVPVALLGVVAYVAILGSVLIEGDAGLLGGAFTALVGFGFSAYLTWAELARIDAICAWCVGSAAAMTALAVLASARLVLAPLSPARYAA